MSGMKTASSKYSGKQRSFCCIFLGEGEEWSFSHGCYPDTWTPLLHLRVAQHRPGSTCFLVGRGGKACSPPQSLAQRPWLLLPWYSTWYSSGPAASPVWELLLLTSPASLYHRFYYTFYFMSPCDGAKPGCTHIDSKATRAMLNLQLSSLNL